MTYKTIKKEMGILEMRRLITNIPVILVSLSLFISYLMVHLIILLLKEIQK